MKRNPGEWLREKLQDRLVEVALLADFGDGVGFAVEPWLSG